MPIYEYKCQSCGDVFEIIQKFSDTPLTIHEKCGGTVERLISVSALQFKGTGFYVNDYGKGHSKDPKPKSDKSDKSDGSNGSGKSDKSEKSNGTTSSSSDSSSSSGSSGKSDTSSSTASSTSSGKTDNK
jgi:putative FmdB family regulatory protein